MAQDLEPWRLIDRREDYSNSRITVSVDTLRLPDGRVIDDYYQVRLTDFAAIFAETKEGRILVLRQYKHGAGRVCLSLPGGHREDGEDWQACAERELLEETGHAGGSWRKLGHFVQNDTRYCGEARYYIARDCVPVAPVAHGDLEEMQLIHMSRAELMAAARRGEFASIGQIALVALATHPELGGM
jgi:ADP-ribose pyrophosphatase